MDSLKQMPGTDLSEYTIHLLRKHDINTVRQFVDATHENLSKITNLSEQTIELLKKHLREKFGCKPITSIGQYYNNYKSSFVNYHTGIVRLDEILGAADDSLSSNSLWEICGLTGCGKTQFLHTLALNFVSNYGSEVVYIDTKRDFSGTRIRQMLRAREASTADAGHAMQLIKVARTASASGLIEMLERLLKQCKDGNTSVSAIKMIIIDSLPSLWLLFCGDSERIHSKHLLTKLAGLLRKLSTQYYIAIILGNLSLSIEEQTIENHGVGESNDEEEFCDKNRMPNISSDGQLTRPLLGLYWNSVPKLRLSLETPTSCVDANVRLLTVLKSCNSATGASCHMRITDAGVI